MASAATIYFPGNLEQVETISLLRAVPSAPLLAESAVLALGGAVFADGSGGVYTWNSASLTADDGLETIRPNDLTPSQAGRWKLVGSGAFATTAALAPLIADIDTNEAAIAANDAKITTEKSRAIAAESVLSIAGSANAAAIAQVQGTITSGRRAYATYAAAVTDAATPAIYPAVTAGTIAEIPITDAGTHTDPVVGGTVSNTGIFRWKATAPSGWERLYDSDAASAAPAAAAAADSAALVADALASIGTVTRQTIGRAPGALVLGQDGGNATWALRVALAAGGQVTEAYVYAHSPGLFRFAVYRLIGGVWTLQSAVVEVSTVIGANTFSAASGHFTALDAQPGDVIYFTQNTNIRYTSDPGESVYVKAFQLVGDTTIPSPTEQGPVVKLQVGFGFDYVRVEYSKLVEITRADYDALPVKDPYTQYWVEEVA